MRWLGWLLAVIVLVGGAGLIWYGIAGDVETAVVEAPAIPYAIDPHVSPEIMRVEGVTVLYAPALSAIDPHVSPEIMTVDGVGVLYAPALSAIDPHVSPEVMRITLPDPFLDPRIP